MVKCVIILLLALYLVYLGIMFQTTSLITVAFALGLYVLVSIGAMVLRYFALTAHVAVPIGVAEPGQEITIEVHVHNRMPVAITKLRYEIVTRNLFLNDKYKTKLYGESVNPGDNVLQFTMIPQEAGNYEVELRRIWYYDLMGTLCLHKRIRRSATVEVNPTLCAIPVALTEPTRSFFGESENYDEFRGGEDPSETFQIREFRDGDKLQKIHWKLSAKMDDLVVKEDSEPKSSPVVLFLDYVLPRDKKSDKVDAFLGVAFSLSYSMMDAGLNHFVSWYSHTAKDIVRVRVTGEETFFYAMSRYLSDRYYGAPRALADLYAEKYRREQYLYELHLMTDLTLNKNRKVFCKFTEAGWKQNLAELEVIL